jgi:Sec-independent protein translocase protein TatA
MWGNLGAITQAVGSAIKNVQKAASELESQMDAAVGDDPMTLPIPTLESAPTLFTAKEKPPKESKSLKKETERVSGELLRIGMIDTTSKDFS